VAEKRPASTDVVTVPNLISAARLVLAIVLFVLVERAMYPAALVAFVIAASTDWIDGWYARRFDAVSVLGRILDPLVDKVIVCGAFILLAGRPAAGQPGSSILPWMAVVVVVRELVVTALRAELERSGRDFSAGWSGKLKMVFQCLAIAAELTVRSGLVLDTQAAQAVVRVVASLLAWTAVVLTVWSGAEYLVAATRLLAPSGERRR
jgi:CDP-diacylglycerol--glycerol-3-phosphate 3-phosphatidyltransferase